jgi:hypothetical protein
MTTATRLEIWPRSQVRHTAGPTLVCVYLVPVHASITTQPHYFEVHESHHILVKKLIECGEYEKGKHMHPEQRKKQDPELRKKQDPELRKKHKKQAPATRKNPDQSGWKKKGSRRHSSQTQTFCRNARAASPSSGARARSHPSELQPFAGTLPGDVAGTPRRE